MKKKNGIFKFYIINDKLIVIIRSHNELWKTQGDMDAIAN